MWSLLLAANLARLPSTFDRYRREDGESRSVRIRLLPELSLPQGGRTRPFVFVSKMTIDTDGAGDAWKHDPAGQPETSLRYPDQSSLDPSKIPYFVLPLGLAERHPGVRLGDVAAVIYKGRVAYAIYGDEGPPQKIGEGSIALARELGIDADPVVGGADEGVEFVVFPGSGDGLPLSPSEIQERAAGLMSQAVRPRLKSAHR
jgi:hypothetical protein